MVAQFSTALTDLDHQAFLARRFPEDEPADRVEVSGPQCGPVRVEAVPLADLVTAASERAIAEAAE